MIEKNLTNHSITSHDKFIFISKSGKTAETKYFLNYVEKYLIKIKNKNFQNNFLFITENTDNI